MSTQALIAPGHWRALDFLSDVHLDAGDTDTFDAWQQYLVTTNADALFILGDLFEVWAGDDVLGHPTQGGFWQRCVSALKLASARMPVYFMPGNRDFLVGDDLLAQAGMKRMDDPTVLVWQSQRWLLSHGDAWCIADEPYQAFRRQVRHSDWITPFLAQPLEERLRVTQVIRQASEARKSTESLWADVDHDTALAQLQSNGCSLLIHGHTHRPAEHRLDTTHRRRVLSDWDARSQPPRLQVLRATLSNPEKGPILENIEQKTLISLDR